MRKPTLKQFRCLCVVAGHQHFGQAASASHLSQCLLSAGIDEPEDALGVSLVERNNCRVYLSLLCAEVVKRARVLLVDVQGMVSLCGGWSTFLRCGYGLE